VKLTLTKAGRWHVIPENTEGVRRLVPMQQDGPVATVATEDLPALVRGLGRPVILKPGGG
jgi:hypothetical protein